MPAAEPPHAFHTRFLQCPEGFFCRRGSLFPARCLPLVVCPPGTSSQRQSFLGLLFLLISHRLAMGHGGVARRLGHALRL